LKIILDFVPNHTSDEHIWFQNSVNRVAGFEDFYMWRDCPVVNNERQLPNNWRSVFHNAAWSYNAQRNQCYLHQFLASQPDLNYRNPKVVEEMQKVLLFWLEKGADGFRVDAINHMFETRGEPDEPYVDENGDKNLWDNIQHIHTMDLVRDIFLLVSRSSMISFKDETYDVVFDWRKLVDDYARDKGTSKK
jgi:alpha-glucosidase